MATHAIGKLKFNWSKQGLAYRWGDGEIHRLFAGKSNADDAENEDSYAEYEGDGYADDYADPGYDDQYDDEAQDYDDDPGFDDGYADDGYDDDGYDDGGYDDDYADDEGYDDDGYADDGYDDGYADDGYDDGYADDEGYDDGEAYDDPYSDEDADGGYGDDGYYANESPLMRYVDENDWVTYLLLFLFPPLGIYLLWRRNRFEKPLRYALSAISAIWFIVALILLFHNIFGGASDTTTDVTLTLAPSATVSALDLDGSDTSDGLDLTVDSLGGDASDTGDESEADTVDTDTETDVDVEPSPTPLTSGSSASGTTGTTSDYVYSPATGLYYHSRSDCTNIDQGVSVSRVPKDVAENNRKQSACPVCIGAAADGDTTTYYATRGGTYYHVDRTCQGMTGATTYTKEAAERAGKTPCPVCILKTAQSLQSGAVKFITSSTTDRSNINVYSTKNGKYYHMTSTCSGMTGATRGSLKDALLAGKDACPVCCKAAGTSVYCTSGGEKYHLDKTCSGMQNAMEVTLAEAMVLGKKRCDVCIKSGALPTASQLAKQADEASDETYVYGTPKGQYYHTDPTCSGMKDAQRYTLKSMLLQKRSACPVCASASNTVVYAKEGGTYYHSYATCSGMTNASAGTMAQAIAAGYKRCPRCWSDTGSNGTLSTGVASTTSAAATATASNTYVYATQAGSYYHLLSNCSGMKNASRITLKQAINAGKKACPTCAGAANRKVYSTEGGKNYHSAPTCKQSGMKNGTARTLAQALMLNQTACKYCIGRSGSSSSSSSSSAKKVSSKTVQSIKAAAAKLKNSHTYKSGTSGIKVYARADGKYYHRRKNCSGMTHASRITLEQAMNYGKRACPVCCSTARRTVYATRGGKYYHYSKAHAGSGAKSGTLASALGYGYDPCPYCVTKTKALSRVANYKSGTSGIKVYTTAGGKYYHSKRNCSDMKNPTVVTLETAMNYGKKPCPKCMASASKKVYSSSGDRYYHYYKVHAGSGAQAGTLAQARALGKKLCPTCAKGKSAGISLSASYSSGSTAKAVTVAKAVAAAKKLSSKGVSAKTAISYSKALASQVKYSASGDTKVYVDLKGKQYYYYHKSSKCSKTGMSKGTKITLQYAKDWGYKACPFCQPPTSVAK